MSRLPLAITVTSIVDAVGASDAAQGNVSITPNGTGVISTAGNWYANQTTCMGRAYLVALYQSPHPTITLPLAPSWNLRRSLTSGTGTITLGNIGTNSSDVGILALSSSAAVSDAGNWYSGNITGNAAITTTGATTIDAGCG